jgi:NAD(P)H-dependent flavin oxidoreductase YrpB (nitropropane dioxygenase family)
MGTTPVAELLALVREAVGDVPVAVAGGFVDAADVAAALAAGADAVALGTRFAASAESEAHDDYKRALIMASGDATVRSVCFDDGWPDAPHRTLRNTTFEAWSVAGCPGAGARPGEGDVILYDNGEAIPSYSVATPTRDMTGDWEAAALYAGTGVSKIGDAPPVAELIDRIMAQLPGHLRAVSARQ